MHKFILVSALLVAADHAYAQLALTPTAQNTNGETRPDQPTQKVIINGIQSQLDTNSDFVAGKLIIGRQQIAESGLQNVGELLKREPTVTVGKDGRISLLGLPGYTQIVFDGEQISGKSPLEMDLSEVERIEIIKTSTAKTGPFGIAGTINVIGKKLEARTSQAFSTGLQSTAGQHGANGAWSVNQGSPNGPWSWNFNVNSSRKPVQSTQHINQWSSALHNFDQPEFTGLSRHYSATEIVSVSSNLSYRFNPREQLSFSPSLGMLRMPSNIQEHRLYTSGSQWNLSNASERNLNNWGGRLFWKHLLEDDSSLKLTLSLTGNQTKYQIRSEVQADSLPPDVQFSRDDSESMFQGLILEHEFNLDGGHELSMGLRWNRHHQNSHYSAIRNGDRDRTLDMFGHTSRVTEETRRIYLQEDWRISRQWAMKAGISGEERLYDITEAGHTSTSKLQVWSPSFHLAKKLTAENNRQLRFSIARNFKAPESADLLLKPTINALAPCDAYATCSRNSLETPDRMGNPNLNAEKAWSFNASYEHGISAESQLRFEVYKRVIGNKVGEELFLQPVPWASQARYVIRPSNLGNAEVTGTSVEWKIAIRDWIKTSPKVDLKGSLTRAHSRVVDLPAPYNRLDGQLPWRIKLGLVYVADQIPIRLHFDASSLPSDWIRNNQTRLSYESRLTSLSSSISWTPNNATRLSFDINSFLPDNRLGIKEYQQNSKLIRRSTERTNHTQMSVRLELKL